MAGRIADEIDIVFPYLFIIIPPSPVAGNQGFLKFQRGKPFFLQKPLQNFPAILLVGAD